MIIKGVTCQSGGKKTSTGRYINEDGVTHFEVKTIDKTYKFIILMDGATGLGRNFEIVKEKTPAEWYVSYMMNELKSELSINPTKPLELAIQNSITKIANDINKYEKENNIILKEYEKPSASLSLLRTDGITTEIYLIGDLETIVVQTGGKVLRVDNPNQKAVQSLDQKVLKRMVKIAKEKNCNVLDVRNYPEIETMLQDNRSKKNREVEDGYWVCGTNSEIIEHGVSVAFDNSKITDIILASDGFDYSLLELNENSVYEQVKQYGTDFVAKLIRNIEEEDEFCNKYPRFKKGDDLTVIHMDYIGR